MALSKTLTVKKLCMCFMLLLVLAPHMEASMSCDTVINDLVPCLTFVTGSGPLQRTCCGGIQSLYKAASSTPDRQSVCSCLKNIASNANGNVGYLRRAASIPSSCGINLPYPLSPSVDCSRVR